MGGRGETVKFTKTYKGPLTQSEKDQLIKDITRTINDTTSELTVMALAKP
jgi:phenylpyruvate tautomerase PptA (4-oxalocrotonate tautomerase family)